MSDLRSPRPEELGQLIEFLDSNLRPETDWSINQEYPVALNPKNLNNIRILTDGEKILSHAVIKSLIVKTPIAIYRAAAIGNVVTHPDHRNQGFSQKILEDCIEQAKQLKSDFAILWTDLYDFYRKLNFELAGTEVALIFDEKIEQQSFNLKFLSTNKVSADSLLKLFSTHSVHSHRTHEDLRNYLEIPNTQVYTAWDSSNQLIAYAVEGRGADLTNYIHEWGGQVPALISLFSKIQEQKQNNQLVVISPVHSQNLIRQCLDNGAKPNYGYLGMIKIINFKDFFFKVRRYARMAGFENFILDGEPGNFVVGLKGQEVKVEDEKLITRMIFNQIEKDDLKHFSPDTQTVIETLFPVPLWMWGWDSV